MRVSRLTLVRHLLGNAVLLLVVCDTRSDVRSERRLYQVREDEGFVSVGVVRSGDLSSPLTIAYETFAYGEAVPGADYLETAGKLEFSPGETEKFLRISIVNDSLPESDKSFSICYSYPSGERIACPSVVIMDNDVGDKGVAFESPLYWVPGDKEDLTVRVFRNNDQNLSGFSVAYKTKDGSARAGSDYAAKSGTIEFSPGRLYQSINISVTRDGSEWDKEFSVELENPTGEISLGANSIARVVIPEFATNRNLAEIIERVRSAQLITVMRQITGEEPVLVEDAVKAISSRYTTSTSLQDGTQLALASFEKLGLNSHFQYWNAAQLSERIFETTGKRFNWETGISDRNVLGIQSGVTRPDEIVVVGAHIDSLPESGPAPGAVDNGSGSVAVLTAAHILSQYEFARTLHFVLFTGEEKGLIGSARYAFDARAGGSNIVASLLPDMIGFHSSGPPRLWVFSRTYNTGVAAWEPGVLVQFTYPNDLAIASVFTNVVKAEGLKSDIEPVIAQSQGDFFGGPMSDYGMFWSAGFPAVWLYEESGTNSPPIHSTDDTISTINGDYFTAVVKAIVGTAAQLAHAIRRKPIGIIEVANSDWNVGSEIRAATFYARNEIGSTESAVDPQDLSVENGLTNASRKALRAYTDFGVAQLETDSRPFDSETIFHVKLAVSDMSGGNLSCGNRLRFAFCGPPDPNRVYLARIQVDGRFAARDSDFDCVTNLLEVLDGGGFIDLPSLVNVPNGTVYGSCEISSRFLQSNSESCTLRFISIDRDSVNLEVRAQLGSHVIDDLESTGALGPTAVWSVIRSYTNYVVPDAIHFSDGWTVVERDARLAGGTWKTAQFFRLKRRFVQARSENVR